MFCGRKLIKYLLVLFRIECRYVMSIYFSYLSECAGSEATSAGTDSIEDIPLGVGYWRPVSAYADDVVP